MITDERTIKKVKTLWLNTYEVKIWTALLSRGVSTAGELSDIANVPRSRSYDVLESLEKKGFVVMKLGKPIKYLAVPPKEVLERVKKNIMEKTDEHITHITGQDFNKLIDDLQKVYEDNIKETDNVIAVLKGSKNIQKHLEFLFKNTEKEVLFSAEKENKRYLKFLQNVGKKQKKVSFNIQDAGLGLCVVDDNVVVFPIEEKDTHSDYDVGVWIKDKQVTTFLKNLVSFA